MTKSEASKLVGVLAAAYPSVKVGQDTAEVYETRLADLEFGLAQQAVARLIDTCRFFPTIAEIREAAAVMDPKPALPSYSPEKLPTSGEIQGFYTLKRFTAETFREPPKPEPSARELRERHELLKQQAQVLLDEEREKAS